MIYRDSKGRAVEITDKEVCDNGVTVIGALYLDDSHAEAEEVPEHELDFIQSHYQDYLQQEHHEHTMSRAYDDYKNRMKYGDE